MDPMCVLSTAGMVNSKRTMLCTGIGRPRALESRVEKALPDCNMLLVNSAELVLVKSKTGSSSPVRTPRLIEDGKPSCAELCVKEDGPRCAKVKPNKAGPGQEKLRANTAEPIVPSKTADRVHPKLPAPVTLNELTVNALPIDAVESKRPCPDMSKVGSIRASPRNKVKLPEWPRPGTGAKVSAQAWLLTSRDEPGTCILKRGMALPDCR